MEPPAPHPFYQAIGSAIKMRLFKKASLIRMQPAHDEECTEEHYINTQQNALGSTMKYQQNVLGSTIKVPTASTGKCYKNVFFFKQRSSVHNQHTMRKAPMAL
eukprot:13172260-Ditylum_brightwellii.AAC.1